MLLKILKTVFCFIWVFFSAAALAQPISLSDIFEVREEAHTASAASITFNGTCTGDRCPTNGQTITMDRINVSVCTTTTSSTAACNDDQHYWNNTSGSLNLTVGTAKTLTLNSTAAGTIRAATHNAPSAASVQAIWISAFYNNDPESDNLDCAMNIQPIFAATCSGSTCTSTAPSQTFSVICNFS